MPGPRLMLVIDTPADMDRHVGQTIGTSAWLAVTQEMIDAFAATTGDDQWIHIDTARAAREAPGGRTIAHGYLTLSLVPVMAGGIWRIHNRSRALNYGANRIRFTSPVPSGARIRLHQFLTASEPIENGRRLVMTATVEIEGHGRPALVAETITLVYDAPGAGAK